MEENTVRMNEIEEREPETEVDEAIESSSGSLVAGVIGGFLAYAVIGGVKKLATFAWTKWTERKQEAKKTAAKDEAVEAEGTQDESGKEAPKG